MTHALRTELGGHAAGRDRLVAALLVVALLFCHGALGALHQASSWPVGGAGGEHHAPTAALPTTEHHAGHHAGDGVAHAEYAAVLFAVLLGAALVLCSGWSSARGLVFVARFFGGVFRPLFLLPPRGPTPPLLQVFRL